MTKYRIVCTLQEPLDKPHDAAHIVSVGVGNDPKVAEKKLTLDAVLKAMDNGDSFYTKSTSTGKEAEVKKYDCGTCKTTTIRSTADSVTDNNLDNLRKCRDFKK